MCLYYTPYSFSGCGRVGIFLQDRWLQCRDMKMSVVNVHLLLFLVAVSITPALLSTTKPDLSSSSADVPSSPAVTATPTLAVFSIMITSEVSTLLTTGALFPTTMPPHTSEATHSTTAQSPPTLSSTEVSTPSKSVPSSGSISLTTGPMPPVSSTTGPASSSPTTGHVSSSQTTGPASSSPEIHLSSKNVPSSSEPHSPSPYPSHCPPQVSDDCDCSDYMRKLYIVVGTTIPASILLTMLAMVPLCWCCQKTKKKGTYIRMAPTVYFDEDDN